MPAQLRVLRRRIRSAGSIKKITKAQELIATSRISRAQARVEAARPYSEEITRVVTALADESALDHPLLVPRENPQRSGVLVVTSDRGLCGGYNANVLRTAEELFARLRDEGKEPVLFVIGRKGENFYRFRQREMTAAWTGFSERPGYPDAQRVTSTLVEAFMASSEAEVEGTDADGSLGVDELHMVYTEFHSMLSQTPAAKRIAPMEIEYSTESAGETTEFEFEPDPDELFRALLPKYLATRVFSGLLEAAASESASRSRAMKSASDNADDLIRDLTLQANRARQDQITQEITEIASGVEALAAAGADGE
jgi:F-type H+-transporting ATPase subunit gamma